MLPSTPASPEALRSNLSLSPDPDSLQRSVSPNPQRFGSPERSPSEYLIAAGGNVSEAAAAAGLTKAEFLQDLGLDASLPQVSNAAHFLVLMGALSLTQLAQDHLQHLLFEAATAEDATSDPFPRVSDPTSVSAGLEALAEAQPSKVSFKEATLLWKHAADFVSAAMAQANPAARPSRFTPPSDRSRIIQASRGLPTNSSNPGPNPQNPQQPHSDLPAGDAELDALRQKLREAPPHVRDMLARALGSNPANPADPIDPYGEAE